MPSPSTTVLERPIGLIVGCARSGTSILGELVAAHEGVKYVYEAHEVWELGGLGPNDSHRMTADRATPEVAAQIRAWFAAQDDGRLIVEKCPRNALRVPYLLEIFPKARFIHIVRDGRDVACSLRPGVGGAEWRHLKPDDWRNLFAMPWAERCARLWVEVVSLAERELANVSHLDIRYEDLVRDPQPEAGRILEFLDLPPSSSVDEFCRRVQDQTAGSYMADNFTKKWNTPDHARRVGRWRENLTPEEARVVTEIERDTLLRWGYLHADGE